MLIYNIAVSETNVVLNPFYGDGAQVYLNEDKTVIMSPHFPKSYKNHASCTWQIASNRTNEIVLTFLDFDLEEG